MPSLVHIVDDDAQVRAATSFLLSSHGYATELYAGGAEFLSEGKMTRGCILLDLRMPDLDGHRVLEELSRRGVRLPVIVMSGHGELKAAVRAMKLGAVDFLTKPAGEEELFAAIDGAIERHRDSEQRHAAGQDAVARLQCLSPRERQILQGLVGGLSNKSIARALGLSPRTVEMHRANMMDDLGVSSLPEALRLALDADLPPLTEGVTALKPREGKPGRPPNPRGASEPAVLGEALRLVLEASADGAWEWTIPTGEIRLSLRLVERLGYDAAEAIDSFDKFRDYVHPDDWEGLVEELEAHLSGRSGRFSAEFRIRTKDGRWAWIDDSGSIIERDAAGAPLRMAGMLTDVTLRKEEQQRARDAAELLDLVQWGAGAGRWEIDLATRRVRLSERSRLLHGVRADAPEWLEESAWIMLIHPDDVDDTRAGMDEAIAAGTPWQVEYRVRTEADEDRWLVALGKVVCDGDGRPRRMVGLARLRDEPVVRAAPAAAPANAPATTSANFASSLAHELRQPLTAIANFSRAIRRRLAATAADDALLREALSGTERSALLASDIIGRLSRQAKRSDAERKLVRLSALVHEAIPAALGKAGWHGPAPAIDLDPAAESLRVDAAQIDQMLTHLLRNAAEATVGLPEGEGRIAIAARRTSPGTIEIVVRDNGPGIDPAVRDRLFEPFVTRPDGIGVGLAICRTIAEAHGGTIRIEPGAPNGTAIHVTLAV